MKAPLFFLVSISLISACGPGTDTGHTNNQDTLIRIQVIDGKNQANYIHPGKRFKFLDTVTKEFIDRKPFIRQDYYARFSLDSVGSRPLVISTRGPVEVRDMGNKVYRVRFTDTGRADINFGLVCTKDTAYQLVEIINKDRIESRDISVYKDTLWFGGVTDLRPQISPKERQAIHDLMTKPSPELVSFNAAFVKANEVEEGSDFDKHLDSISKNILRHDKFYLHKFGGSKDELWVQLDIFTGGCTDIGGNASIKGDTLILYSWINDLETCAKKQVFYLYNYRVKIKPDLDVNKLTIKVVRFFRGELWSEQIVRAPKK